MNNRRPINLNLFTISFPITAIVSILHRASGAFLFLLIPLALWTLDFSLTESGFDTLSQWMGSFYVKAIFWMIFIPFCFHLVAGIRHLLSDIHIGDSLRGGKLGAILTFIITALFVIGVGIWLW